MLMLLVVIAQLILRHWIVRHLQQLVLQEVFALELFWRKEESHQIGLKQQRRPIQGRREQLTPIRLRQVLLIDHCFLFGRVI